MTVKWEVVGPVVRESSVREAADRLGVTERTVYRYRKALGLADEGVRRPGPVDEEWRRRVRSLLDEGASVKAAASVVGSSTRTVRRHFPGEGWSLSEAGSVGWAAMRAAAKGAF